MKENSWDLLPTEERESKALKLLIQIDLEHADPDFASSLQKAMDTTTDFADRMRLDIAMSDKVVELREVGKMLSIAQIREKVGKMVGMDSNKMQQALADFSKELNKTKKS